MTIQEKKHYLAKAYRLERATRSYIKELQILREALESLGGGGWDGMPHATRSNGETADIMRITKATDLEATIKGDLLRAVSKWKIIHEAVEALPDMDERLVLRMRYIEGRTWDEISADMHFGRAQVFTIHDEALKVLKLPEKTEEAKVETDADENRLKQT